MAVQRQDTPEGEIAALEDEVTACLDMLRGHFRTLLDAAYTAKVEGEPPTDKWPDIDHALRAFAWESCAEVAESIAAYIDGDQEALLAALAPADGEADRIVWDVPDLSDAALIEDHHAAMGSGARVYVSADREWVVYMMNNMTRRVGRGRGRLVRHAVVDALKEHSPLDAAIQSVEGCVLGAARELAGWPRESDAVADAAG